MRKQTLPIEDGREDLPICIRTCLDRDIRDIAESIFDCLISISELVPPGYRLARCPSDNLSKRKAALIFARVNEGEAFPYVVKNYNSESVEFVGVAAGALMAIRHGALSPSEETIFKQEFPKLTNALYASSIQAIPNRKLKFFGAFLAIVRQTIGGEFAGSTTLKQSNGFWYQETIVGNKKYIEAFGALPIGQYPILPRGYSPVSW